MNIEARLKKLEEKFCPCCGKRLQSLLPQGDVVVDITTLSVEQKRALYEALRSDKFVHRLDSDSFRQLPVEEKIKILRTPDLENW
jgi:hypothetical protein